MRSVTDRNVVMWRTTAAKHTIGTMHEIERKIQSFMAICKVHKFHANSKCQYIKSKPIKWTFPYGQHHYHLTSSQPPPR